MSSAGMCTAWQIPVTMRLHLRSAAAVPTYLSLHTGSCRPTMICVGIPARQRARTSLPDVLQHHSMESGAQITPCTCLSQLTSTSGNEHALQRDDAVFAAPTPVCNSSQVVPGTSHTRLLYVHIVIGKPSLTAQSRNACNDLPTGRRLQEVAVVVCSICSAHMTVWFQDSQKV